MTVVKVIELIGSSTVSWEDAVENAVKEAIRIAKLLFNAKPALSGKFDIILDGKAGGTMIHEACGHGLE
ncbi:MAG: hypothetical protein DRO01_08035, partial [Thermoproteota archaeon]